MNIRHRIQPRLAATALLAGAFVIAACQGATSSTPPSVGGVPSSGASSAPSAAPAATAQPTALQLMAISLLPEATVPADVEVACDDPADATLSCADAVELAARMAITTSGSSPIEQVLVERTEGDPNVVEITFWAIDAESTELTAYSATVDVEAQTITFPAENEDATFPPA